MATRTATRVASLLLLALLSSPLLASDHRSAEASSSAPLATEGQSCPLGTCYRTYPEIQSYLQSIVASYPQIASLQDAGPTWEGTRHIWVLHLSNADHPGPKPGLFMVAGQHARDLPAPELLLRFVDYLTHNYGSDPDVTWLVDNRDLGFIVLANPDGYYSVYTNGYCLRVKNTHSYGSCEPANSGVDLNRNYPYEWNRVGGSADPCDNSYPGPSALSEPETVHILDAITSAAPGLMVEVASPPQGNGEHSIRYPWGWTTSPPPDVVGLDALSWALARLNNTPRQSVTQQWRAPSGFISGTLADTAYSMGIPALTINAGDDSYLVCSDLDALWLQQLPAFIYAAKTVGIDPYSAFEHPFGPDARNLSVAGADRPGAVQFTAVLSTNVGTVAGAVYKVDDPGVDGEGQSMSGNFGGSIANVSANVDTSTLPNGRHMLFVQGKNNNDQWGVLSSIFFTLTGNLTATPTPTGSFTATPTSSRTPTVTRTTRPTDTLTPSNTPSLTRTVTPTRTFSSTSTPTAGSHTPTQTRTPSITHTPSATRTPSFTLTPSITRTPSSTYTPSVTRTPSFTRTPTQTRTTTLTPILTVTRTATSTRTPTFTRTPSPPDTPTPLPCAAYTDVHTNQYFYVAVNWLTCHGIISGYSDGTFRPNNNATRAQIVKMIVLGEGWQPYTPSSPTFSDVLPGDWFYSPVETAYSHGIIGGYGDGTFRPYNDVTRGQLSKMLVLAQGWTLLDPETGHFSDVPRGSAFYTYIETALARNIISGYGDGTFRPGNNATRGQLSKMLYSALTTGNHTPRDAAFALPCVAC